MEDHCACNRNLQNAEIGSSVAATMQSQAEWAAAKQRVPILPPRGEGAIRECRSRTYSKTAWQREECERHSQFAEEERSSHIRNAAVKRIAAIHFNGRSRSASTCKAP